MLQQVSWQRQMPIRVVVSKQSYVKAFCVSMKRPCFSTMFMLVFLSWVELCTEALTCWWESTSMMILFLDSCSCMRMTFSVPCIHQAGSHFGVAEPVGCHKLHLDTCHLMLASGCHRQLHLASRSKTETCSLLQRLSQGVMSIVLKGRCMLMR